MLGPCLDGGIGLGYVLIPQKTPDLNANASVRAGSFWLRCDRLTVKMTETNRDHESEQCQEWDCGLGMRRPVGQLVGFPAVGGLQGYGEQGRQLQ